MDIDTAFDTDTSTASDETTSVFWTSGGDGGFTTNADAGCGGGALDASGLIAGVSQRGPHPRRHQRRQRAART